MKFYESQPQEYVARAEVSGPLDREAPLRMPALPVDLRSLCNLVFFGPPGAGKYTLMLRTVNEYRIPGEVQYDKRVSVQYNKQVFTYHVSNVHFEVDFALLGCNAKLLWHEVYSQIVEMVLVRPARAGIVVCKNFHAVHRELLDIFYSYMQQYNNRVANISPGGDILLKYIFLTETMSILPASILGTCMLVRVPAARTNPAPTIHGAANLKCSRGMRESFMAPAVALGPDADVGGAYCSVIAALVRCIDEVIADHGTAKVDFLALRESAYDILVYNLNLGRVLWRVLRHVLCTHAVSTHNAAHIIARLVFFFKMYNNNYRPVYHLEHYLLTVALYASPDAPTPVDSDLLVPI